MIVQVVNGFGGMTMKRILSAMITKLKGVGLGRVENLNDEMRLTDREFDVLIQLVTHQHKAAKTSSQLDAKAAKKVAFFSRMLSKLEHTKANGISSKRAEVNATKAKFFCGDKEIFQIDLTR